MTATVRTEDPPSPAGGGPIPDGRYVLTAFTVYTGADGGLEPAGSARLALLVSNHGTALRLVQGLAPNRIEASRLTYDGVHLRATTVCPTADLESLTDYSVEGDKVRFFNALLGNRTMVSTYIRQP